MLSPGASSTPAQAGCGARLPSGIALEGLDRTARPAAARTLRRVDHAVGGVVDPHPAALDRPQLDPDAGRAAERRRHPRCRREPPLGDVDRVLELVDLDPVMPAHAGIADMDQRSASRRRRRRRRRR